MFSKLKLIFIATALATPTTLAANILAVLEITPGNNDDINLTISEYRHLTDELRTQAREILPPQYTVLTRDNIFQLIPPDEKEAECLAESCAVDIGRAIGAEYVTQGSIGKFEEKLTLTVELYESMSGNMLGSFVTESDTPSGLLNTIREKAPALFAKITPPPLPPIVQPIVQPTIPEPIPATIPTNIPAEPEKSYTSMWVAIGLDVLGATAIGLGIYNNAKAKEYYSESEKILKNARFDKYDEMQSEFDSKYKKMQDAQTARDAFYAIGSALLLGGIAVHIWF